MKPEIEEAEELMRKHEREPEHVLQVRRMAMALFDQLAQWHGLDGEERFCLEAAALLHDIGYVHAPDGRGHHKWSARMIREHAWRTLDARCTRITACVARYHRKSPPSPEHEEFAILDAPEQMIVAKLAAMLRVADSLDRSHLQAIRAITVHLEDRKITILADPAGDITAEKAIFAKKAELFERVFDCKLALAG
jgi:exopolyphosphatase/guanosine-5'-triphosphate,3'-diphosphate pyrophosphatase